MGRPPDPHSTLVPVRTTAAPRLTPDLIAGLPWPHWAPIAVAVVAGILVVSCLLCAICCCCRHGHRHGKKPRDKEAVGLGGLPGTTTTHLVQPDVDNEGDPKPWGRLLLSLQYDFGSQEIRVGLKQAADLRPGGPGGTADPYARVSLSTQAGRWHETRVHRGTLCPVFDETCCFHASPAELPRSSLQVQVLDFRRFSRHEPLGSLSLPLGAVDLQHVLELWHQLGPPGTAEPEQTGDLCFSLRYTPGSGRLTVVVLEARGLSPTLADPYVKVQLMLNQRKWKKRKTQARKGPAAPYFNEAFAFLVPISQVQVGGLEEGAGQISPGTKLTPVLLSLHRPSACLCPECGSGARRLGPGPTVPGRACGQGAAGRPGLWSAPPALGGHAGPSPAAHHPVASPAACQGGGPGPGPAAPLAPAPAWLLKPPPGPRLPGISWSPGRPTVIKPSPAITVCPS
uniref:Synaptotagmin 8 n=1 Tax=Equus caballus TaxID=9796 RepID=A0A3Q2IAV8_HORSE